MSRSITTHGLLTILLTVGFVLGSVSGACTCHGFETVAGMRQQCDGEVYANCHELCLSISEECADAAEWESCPAGAWGIDFGQCEDFSEGVPLDVGCDDPLPYKQTNPDGFEYFACCCQYTIPD
jgi:hypothetical protein